MTQTPDTTEAKRPKRLRPLAMIAGLVALLVIGFYVTSVATADPADNNAQTQNQADDAADDADTDETSEEEAGDEAESDEPEKAPIPVQVTTAERGEVAAYISATANLVAEHEVRVIAEWEGRLTSLAVDEGDRIRKGQVIAQLDAADRQIAIEKARVRLADADQKLARGEKLYKQELLAQEDYDKLNLEQRIAKQEMAEAEHNLEKTRIRAPFTGVVTGRTAQPGQHVRPGDELFVIADFEPLVARVYLPEKDVLALNPGRSVRLTLDADNSIQVTGKIQMISPVVDTATGTVKVTVEVSNPPREVRPGAFVRVDVVRERRADSVLIPKAAVVHELQRTYIFVADDDTAERRAIELGIEEGKMVEALSGIDAGDQIITAGQGGLRDGAKIAVHDDSADDTDETDRLATR
ncbi:MAG: efflux RND transporter periplasmic adaptor subunit [Acidobacteriota bacterium]